MVGGGAGSGSDGGAVGIYNVLDYMKTMEFECYAESKCISSLYNQSS